MMFPLVGVDRIKTAAEGMIAANKIPHAILIEGDSGMGKSTLARFICNAAVCSGTPAPCGTCDDCRLTASENHPDIVFVTPEKDRKTISVNSIRQIVDEAYVLPQKSNKKVFIIDPADIMTVSAQNALLKILEEPPASVVFILTAFSKNDLLNTIVSRCTVFTLTPPEEYAAREYVLSETKRGEEEVSEALKKAHGSIGTALNILRKKSASKAGDLANTFFDTLKKGNSYELLKLLFALEKDRANALEFYNELEVIVALNMRSCSSATLVRRYEKIRSVIAEHKNLIKQNTNLSLLLSSLVMEITER